MIKMCIICRKLKQKFNAEHVILATIGGGFEIDTVCKSCNENLSKKFNIPFLKSPLIGLYRKQLGLYRKDGNQSRNIANPFKNVKLDGVDSEKYYMAFNKNQLIAKRKPEVNVKKVKGGWQGSIIVSKDDAEVVKANVLKKYGFEDSQVSYKTTETISPSFTFDVRVPTSPLFLESLKMAYEFTVTVLPSYFNDRWAKLFSNFLHTYESKDVIVARLESINNILPLLKPEILELAKFPLHCHILTLKQIDKIGLFCFVKVFDRIYPIHISDDIYLSNPRTPLAIYNDALNQVYHWNLSMRWGSINLSINRDNAPDYRENFEKTFLDECERDENGVSIISIFDKNGKLVTSDLTSSIPILFPQVAKLDFGNRKVVYNAEFLPDTFFVKYKPDNSFLAIEGLSCDYNIAL